MGGLLPPQIMKVSEYIFLYFFPWFISKYQYNILQGDAVIRELMLGNLNINFPLYLYLGIS